MFFPSTAAEDSRQARKRGREGSLEPTTGSAQVSRAALRLLPSLPRPARYASLPPSGRQRPADMCSLGSREHGVSPLICATALRSRTSWIKPDLLPSLDLALHSELPLPSRFVADQVVVISSRAHHQLLPLPLFHHPFPCPRRRTGSSTAHAEVLRQISTTGPPSLRVHAR